MGAFLNNPPPKVEIKQENSVSQKINDAAAGQDTEESIQYIRYPLGYVLKQDNKSLPLESTYSVIHLLQIGGFFTSEARFNDFFKQLTKQQQTDITN